MLMRLNPQASRGLSPLASPFRDFDRLFDTLAGELSPAGVAADSIVPLNVWHDDDAVHVEAELPGVRAEDLDIDVRGDQLTIRGRRLPDRPETAKLLRAERVEGEFERGFTLPFEVDADHVTADLTNGVLRISLPKLPDQKPRRIEVRTS